MEEEEKKNDGAATLTAVVGQDDLECSHKATNADALLLREARDC